ncbi:hypothetical protein CEXT_293231 [Caerostris extrusa]|uniref:Uncharacterized protein n=1 Tax=Caerostris extrusa TaxID=172846 RepID=A0AAV4U8H5_CAEEX|nr:hypothetical protein CEXT_293231 [Caerostris extrusa]
MVIAHMINNALMFMEIYVKYVARHVYILLDDKQREMHNAFCEKELERDMELSFAVQLSLDKFRWVLHGSYNGKLYLREKGDKSLRFGILEKCNHVFCLTLYSSR